MAEPLPMIGPDDISDSFRWFDVMQLPKGKARMTATRDVLRDVLSRELGAPNASKDFLSEKLIKHIGKSGKVSSLPKRLRDMIPNKAAQQRVVDQVGYAYRVLSGKTDRKMVDKAFNATLEALKKSGADEKVVDTLRKIGPQRMLKSGGFAPTIATMKASQQDTNIMKLFQWVSNKVAGRTPPEKLSLPEAVGGAVAKVKPSPAAYEALAGAGVKGASKLSRVARAATRGGTVIPAAFVGYDLYSRLSEWGSQEDRAQAMAKTGIIPNELGGQSQQTSAQFLRMMQDRKEHMMKARSNAILQEGDLSRQIMGVLATGDGQSAQNSGKIQLGSARTPTAPQGNRSQEEVKQLFDALLREASQQQ